MFNKSTFLLKNYLRKKIQNSSFFFFKLKYHITFFFNETIYFYFNILVIYNQTSSKTNITLCIILFRQDNSINTYNIIHKNLSSNKTLT